jgi:hypothetical protein
MHNLHMMSPDVVKLCSTTHAILQSRVQHNVCGIMLSDI